MTSEFIVAATTQKNFDSLSLLDPKRFAVIDYALRYYFFVERYTQVRTWSEVSNNPNSFCNCYSCEGRRNDWLRSNQEIIGKMFPYNG